MKWWLKVLLLLLVLLVMAGIYVFTQVRVLTVEQITDDVHVISGIGGNVGVLKTESGTVIIDTMTLRYQGKRIREEAERLTGQDVVMIINTHYHLDHTHGNPAFEAGTRVVSTKRTLHHMKITDADYFDGEAATFLPNETFEESHKIELGNKTINLFNTGRGHTDGDLVAFIVEDEVLHAGDLYFNQLYPNIDLEGGGSVQAWGDTLASVLAIPFVQVIPGHGAVSGRKELMQFQDFIRQLARIGQKAADEGWTREETLKSSELTLDAGYEEIKLIIPIGLNRNFVLGRAWDETTGNVVIRD